ncbi:YdcF family protein [Streptomyces sp. WMMB303]|uniref:YdcF family protein n=1 Tax=Streptomyces sp. WMMB303 TaxID=3034154 RepID=UPI0023ED6D56|nr:YdcF family protein [Streptomyces sp. WMMB303]MDF4251900.1 YdcF family protein [Streptomyces sp. WMMB303]
MRRRTVLATAGAVTALAWGEWLNRRWSRTLVPNGRGAASAVVVLGYRNPQVRANAVNRWRVRAGIRSIGAGAERDARLIFSGGAVGSGVPEARLMAAYARSVLGFEGTVLLDERSATTWENIANVLPLLENTDRIEIVSQPAHALKARAYLRRQRPDLAERVGRADDYRPGEWLIVKPLLALYGLWTLRGLTADERRPPRRTAPSAAAPVARGSGGRKSAAR